ncbi:MAG: glycosyltransferase [Pseudomonadota bacterium]
MSVIIAAYRASATLPTAVASALAQNGVTVEVIVVDDASPDDTATIADGLAAADPRVRVIRLSENGGPGAARNAGFDAATGDWIAVLDADDSMATDRLVQMTAFGTERGANAVYDNLAVVRADRPDETDQTYLDAATFGAPAQWNLVTFIKHNQARPGQPSFGYLKPVFQRAFLAQHNLRYAPILRNGEDFHLMLDALVAGASLWYFPAPLYRYTTGAASISSTLNLDHARHLIAASVDFIGENSQTLPRNAISEMEVRKRRLQDFATAETMLRALKAKRFGKAIAALFTNPRGLFRFCQQMCQAIANRL